MKRGVFYLVGGLLLSLYASVFTLLHVTYASWLLVPVWFFLTIVFCGSLLLAQFSFIADFDVSEWVMYSVGLSVFQLIALGLILNTIGLATHHATLIMRTVVPAFNGLIILLTLLLILRKRISLLVPKKQLVNDWLAKLAIGIAISLPILGVFGAERLNNGASNKLSIITYLLVILLVGAIVFIRRLRSETIIIASLWSIGLMILLSYSMRSNHLIGYDINQEFEVFTTTLKNGLWHPRLFGDTYNACLSITILPTLLKSLMPISAELVFKLVMQALFAFVSIGVYTLAKYMLAGRKNVRIYAFMASLFFIIQYQFLNEFPALIRQQVATVFFALIFITAANPKISKKHKSLFMLIFGLGMVVSHYSTAYVCLALLILTVVIKHILTWFIKHTTTKSHTQNLNWYISPIVVLVMLLFAFAWYSELLNSTGGIVQKMGTSITNIGQIFSSDSHSQLINQTFGGTTFVETPQIISQAALSRTSHDSYADSLSEKYSVSPAVTPQAHAKNGLQSIILKTTNTYVPGLIKIVVLVGAASMILDLFYKKRALEEAVLTISAGIAFTLLILLPLISKDYNIVRLYQQLLVFLSCTLIIGVAELTRLIRLKYVEVTTFILLILYYLCTSGIVSQLVFGTSNINFDNSDLNYVHFYAQDADIDSLHWLQNTYDRHPDLISIGRYSLLKTYSYTTLPNYSLVPGLLPSQIYRSSYVFASSINLDRNMVFDSYMGQPLVYTFPRAFLNSNKNVIYSNGQSYVYK